MIRTKDLEEFLGCVGDILIDEDWDREYREEIVARLRELDKLKEEIKSGQK